MFKFLKIGLHCFIGMIVANNIQQKSNHFYPQILNLKNLQIRKKNVQPKYLILLNSKTIKARHKIKKIIIMSSIKIAIITIIIRIIIRIIIQYINPMLLLLFLENKKHIMAILKLLTTLMIITIKSTLIIKRKKS